MLLDDGVKANDDVLLQLISQSDGLLSAVAEVHLHKNGVKDQGKILKVGSPDLTRHTASHYKPQARPSPETPPHIERFDSLSKLRSSHQLRCGGDCLSSAGT